MTRRMHKRNAWFVLLASWGLPVIAIQPAAAQLAIRGEIVYPMAGPPIKNGVVLTEGNRITRVGPASAIQIPVGMRTISAKIVTPGLIDAHSVVGLTGYLNQDQDQDQLDVSEPIQPELRALDSYNPRERLIEWVRGFGITTLHTGHAPGAVISGQTLIVKTSGNTVEDALVRPTAMLACTLGEDARAKGRDAEKKVPGTRSKAVAILREQLVRAGDYRRKLKLEDEKKRPDRDLRMEAMVRVLDGEWPLLVTAHRATDIVSALRIASEFRIKIVLDGAAESYLVMDEIKKAGVPVILHPTMTRSGPGETENLSMETAAKLIKAGIPVALQSGFESYVPKTRVALFEAAIAAANGLTFEQALGTVTIEAAKILGVADRVGSLEPGKEADIALYDGDPFEYTTHCIGVIVNGVEVAMDPQ